MNLKKWTIFIFFFIVSFNIKAETFFDYNWNQDDQILIDYVEKNKDLIIRHANDTYDKSSKYRTFIEQTAKEYGVPKEIFILAGMESEFNPKASSSNAVGMWQFLKGTSQSMGLKVNSNIDERENWKKSTIAAVKYIKYLAEEEFNGDYELGLLAYNAGSNRIKNSIDKYQTANAWKLIKLDKSLRKETRDYLPKFVSYANYYAYLDEKNKKELNNN